MKKFISLVAASAVTITSFSAFAAPYFSDFAEADRRLSNIPKEETVETKLDIKSATNTDYSDHETQSKALSTTSTSMVVNAQATLDMSNVAQQWNAYLDAAVNTAVDRAPEVDKAKVRENAVKNVKLEGEYTIKITGSSPAIVNEKLAAKDNTGWEWDETTTKLFKQKSVDYDAATNTFTLVMDINGSNEDFDAYFTSLKDDAESKNLVLTIPGTKITAQNALTTTGEYHNVKGDFSGWVTVSYGSKQYSKVNFADDDTEYYKFYRRTGGSGGGGGGGTKTTPAPKVTDAPTVTTAPTETVNPSVPSDRPTAVPNPEISGNGKVKLDYDNHYAYIIGYPAEPGHENELTEVRPNNNITRAEVATIFFRMLEDESRAAYWTQDNTFSDVSIDQWYNNAISTAANADIVNGYPDGTFKPNAPITRAEFAAIAARFTSLVHEGDDLFSDISTHWARAAINNAAKTGWINGYEDGTFKPDQYIKRSEAMTLVNRVLYRLADVDGVALNSEAKMEWIDNLDKNAWYYAAVQEATNSHDYDREAIGAYETWTVIVAPRDWEALEKSYSKVTDAGSEESVAKDLLDTMATAAPEATAAPDASEAPAAE